MSCCPKWTALSSAARSGNPRCSEGPRYCFRSRVRTGRRVFLASPELELTSTEFNLLEFFLTHAGRAYSRDQLLEAVWGEQRYVTPRTVDVHVRRLRERIEEQPEQPKHLTTVRGFGYRFEESA